LKLKSTYYICEVKCLIQAKSTEIARVSLTVAMDI